MKLTMGGHEMELGGRYLGHLRDAQDLLGDRDALRARMEEDGYLLLRGFHPREKMDRARRMCLESLRANGQLDESRPLEEGAIAPGAKGTFRGGIKPIIHTPEFLDVVESPALMQFFAEFLGAPVLTFRHKWLRAIPRGVNTGAHYDVVYMGRGTSNLYTCWTPFGDLGYEMGPLCMLVGSHRFERVKATYGRMDVDRDGLDGWLSRDPLEVMDRHGGQWQTAEFALGDIMIFGMFTMHGSLDNVSNRYRISCDTRYQRADEPADERWAGDAYKGHELSEEQYQPIEAARVKWGV